MTGVQTCALPIYGRLPESLDALVPEYLDALPRDSRTGGPFTLFDLDGRLVVHSDRAAVSDANEWSLNRPQRAIVWWAERVPASSVAEVLLPPTDRQASLESPAFPPSPLPVGMGVAPGGGG